MFVEPIKNKKFMFVERGGKKVHVRCLVIQLPILPSHLTSPHLTRKCETTSDCDLISFHSDLKLRERERFCVFGLRLESRETMGAFIKLDDSPMFLKQVQAQSDSLSYIYFFTININFYTWLVMGLDSIFNLLELDSTKIVIKRLFLRFLMVETAEPMSFFFVTVSFCI